MQEYSQQYRTGQSVSFWTYHHIREDAEDLFGFQYIEELSFFKKMITVSGVGPRVALGIVSMSSIPGIANAIHNGDIEYLTNMSGIGRKTAEKIILELKNQISEFTDDRITNGNADTDVVEALVAMGYNHTTARQAVQKIDQNIEKIDEKIRETLKIIR